MIETQLKITKGRWFLLAHITKTLSMALTSGMAGSRFSNDGSLYHLTLLFSLLILKQALSTMEQRCQKHLSSNNLTIPWKEYTCFSLEEAKILGQKSHWPRSGHVPFLEPITMTLMCPPLQTGGVGVQYHRY